VTEPGSAEPPSRGPRIALAAAVLGLAGAAIFFGAVIDWLACDVESSEACERQGLARLQLGVAWLGLVPGLAFAVAAVAWRRRAMIVSLAVAISVYATWAVLADAAVHGWDDLKLLP
jgi:hypothetical protein